MEYGVYSTYNFTTIKNCRIKEGLTAGSSDFAVEFYKASNGTIKNNTILTSGNSGYGIYLYLGSKYNTVLSNTITTSGDHSSGVNVYDRSNFNTSKQDCFP